MDTPLDQVYLNGYFHLLGVTILFYDHIQTLQDEYQHIWRNPRIGASCLFFLNRYFAFISNVVMTGGAFWKFGTTEASLLLFDPSVTLIDVLSELSEIFDLPSIQFDHDAGHSIQLLRTWALYRRSSRILGLMVTFAVGLSAGAIYVAIGPTVGVSLDGGCTIASPRHTAIGMAHINYVQNWKHLRLYQGYAVAWEALFIWDSLIFTLTIAKTYKTWSQESESDAAGGRLVNLMTRDGAAYFAVMACAQCANSLTYYLLLTANLIYISSMEATPLSQIYLNGYFHLVGVIIQILRTYALYGRDWRTMALMVVVASAVGGGALFVAIPPTPGITLNGGCTITSPRPVAIRYAAAWEALFIWDSFIFVLTIVKTYKQRFQYSAVVGGNNLLSLIVRDGAVYFAVMACAQCVNSLTYYFLPPALIGVLSTFASGGTPAAPCAPARLNLVAHSCADYALFRQTALIASQCMVARAYPAPPRRAANASPQVAQSLRTYALYGRSRRVAALVFGVGPALGVLSVVAIIGQRSTVVRAGGCHIASSRETAIRIAVAWESLFLFDLMIFGLTFYKSYQERFRFAHTGRNNLTALIMRDGAVYFAVMACAQCANTLTFYLLAPALRGVLSTLASNVSVTMMARLMLNLHQQAAHGVHESTTGMGRARKSSGVVFRVWLEAGPSTALSAGGTEQVEEHELRALR
ncbi:hypothetical protein PHLGIDRAFT_126033 [Phlebiopsis gigantea 11061_1 CR5-6]|uniref:DUF6533 domain-containing protein n=1 Tax=Phlebiopsis gigantea (strain 11061_1 CR5-6) TaxID=745531 RepID=A0A0C3S2V2_PHLG1|nr:hypothetical protein PHLGIDRAFT_126033 [Phlebiopsis gigantea 11061_1 CR5-6]